ncbi:hypothetical protein Tco_0480338 [Tanacetum coccineum]
MIIKKDSEIVKAKVKRKSLALKSKKESSDEESSTSKSKKSKEYAQRVVRELPRKFFKRRGRCEDPNHLIGECLKPPKDKNQRAFVEGSWSDSGEEDDEKAKDEACLMAHASSEICLGIDLEPDKWIKDNRCSKHMTGNRKLFSTYKAYNGGNVVFGSNLRGNIIGKGQICDNKCKVIFFEHDSEITKDGIVIVVSKVDRPECAYIVYPILPRFRISPKSSRRYVVPTGRVVVPAGRYIVPAGKVILIVSTGRLSLVPTGRVK